MDINNIGQFILKAIEYYDEQQEKYKDLINSKKEFDESNNEIKFTLKNDNVFGTYEILGYFDKNTKIWVWGWVSNQASSSSTQICKNLLNYGLKLEPRNAIDDISEHYFIKTLLVNSRILIDDEIQLDINLAIYSYLLKGKISFILPKYVESSNIIIYSLIKI